MDKRKNIMIPLIKSIFHKNPGTYFLILGTALLIAIPLILKGTSDSILASVQEARARVYGSFSHIIYEAQEEKHRAFILSDDDLRTTLGETVYDQLGVLYIGCQEIRREEPVNLGWADASAVELGHITLLEGRFPVSSDEIAVTESVLKLLGAVYGDLVEFSEGSYKIIGVIEDYGRLWPKGERQYQLGITFPQVFMAENEVERISKGVPLGRTILVHIDETIIPSFISGIDLYYNANAIIGTSDTLFSTPLSFTMIACLVCIFLIGATTLLYRQKIRYRYNVYGLLGLSFKRQHYLLFVETVVLSLCGIAVGLLFGYGGVFLSVHLLEQRLQREITLVFDLTSCLFSVITAVVVLTVFLQLAVFLSFERKTRKFHKRIYKRRNGLFKLAFLMFRSSPRLYISMTLMTLLSVSFIIYISCRNVIFVQKNEYKETNEAYLSEDYDFELTASGFVEGAPPDNEHIVRWDSFEKEGLSAADLEELEKIPGVQQVQGYKQNQKMFLWMDIEEIDPYLDVSDYSMDGNIGGMRGVLSEYLDPMEDRQAIATELFSYSPGEIESFSPFIDEGNINIDQLNSGEEVILVVPAILQSEQIYEDGSFHYNTEFVSKDTEGAYNDSLYHVGDIVDLSELRSEVNRNTYFTETEACEIFSQYDTSAHIGAIIRTPVGWFSNPSGIWRNYIFITTDKGMAALGIDTTYTRTRITISENVDIDGVLGRIQEVMSSYPDLHLHNTAEQLKNYRELKELISLMCLILSIIAGTAGFVVLVSGMSATTRLYENHYRIYRMVGMHFSEVILVLFLQTLIVLLPACLVMVPAGSLLFSVLEKESFCAAVLMAVRSVPVIITAIIPLLAVTVAACTSILTDHKIGHFSID